MVEALLGGEDIANVDADLLRELYTPMRHSFAAYIHGAKHADLRFMVSDSGAMPNLPSPEETAVINRDPDGGQDGIWYLEVTAKQNGMRGALLQPKTGVGWKRGTTKSIP